MKRFQNYLQIRLYASFSVIAILITLLIIVGTQLQNTGYDRNDQTRAASQLSTNAYMLVTMAHRYIDAPTEEDSKAIKQTIEEQIDSTSHILEDLKNGDIEHDTPALDLPELKSLRDQVANEWERFLPTVNQLFATDPSRYEEQVILVDNAAVKIPDLAEELTQHIDDVSVQEKTDGTTFTTFLVILLAIMFAGAILLVVQSVRSIRQLASTAGDFAKGNFKVRANTKTFKEIAQVSTTFNQMADQIDQLVRDLEHQIIVSEDARARAERSDQVKSAFLASVSHELRTPLNAIINFSKFVVKGVMGPVTDQQTEALNKVVQSGKHLLNLINDVLDISKIESGSLSLFVEQNVDMSEILRQTYALSEALLEGKPVKMELNIDGDLPNVSADRQRLRQIMTNLLSNACKFTETGSIKVNAKVHDEKIEVTVEDTGPGIAAEDFHLVFESFKQTSTGLRQGKGTGLGMPISKSLAEAMGGKLWFESEVNKGTTFFFTLPARSEQLVKIPA